MRIYKYILLYICTACIDILFIIATALSQLRTAIGLFPAKYSAIRRIQIHSLALLNIRLPDRNRFLLLKPAFIIECLGIT